MKFLVLGGGMSQPDTQMSEYLDCTKELYKDLISVAKDADSGQITSQSLVF
jgi:hypothetical protein